MVGAGGVATGRPTRIEPRYPWARGDIARERRRVTLTKDIPGRTRPDYAAWALEAGVRWTDRGCASVVLGTLGESALRRPD
jgi:hypothetical protein